MPVGELTRLRRRADLTLQAQDAVEGVGEKTQTGTSVIATLVFYVLFFGVCVCVSAR